MIWLTWIRIRIIYLSGNYEMEGSSGVKGGELGVRVLGCKGVRVLGY